MNQKYFKADGTEQGQSAGPDIGKLLDMLKEKLAGISQPIIPTKRKEQIEGQERAAESPEAKPAPTPTPKPAAKPKKKHDGWVDAGYGTGPLNAQGLQWQGAGTMPPAPPVSDPGPGGPMPPMPAPPGQPAGGAGTIGAGSGIIPGGNGGGKSMGPGPVGPPVPQPLVKAGAVGQGNLASSIGAAAGKKKKPAAPEFRPPGMLDKG